MSHPRLQNDLFFIAGPHNLEKLAKYRIALFRNHEKVASQSARDLERPILVFGLQDVDGGFSILVLRSGQTAKFPAEWQFNGDYVVLFIRILKINSVVARRMVKHLFFRGR